MKTIEINLRVALPEVKDSVSIQSIAEELRELFGGNPEIFPYEKMEADIIVLEENEPVEYCGVEYLIPTDRKE